MQDAYPLQGNEAKKIKILYGAVAESDIYLNFHTQLRVNEPVLFVMPQIQFFLRQQISECLGRRFPALVCLLCLNWTPLTALVLQRQWTFWSVWKFLNLLKFCTEMMGFFAAGTIRAVIIDLCFILVMCWAFAFSNYSFVTIL